MSKVTGKLLAMILSFVMVFTGVTFLGGTVAVNAAEGDASVMKSWPTREPIRM